MRTKEQYVRQCEYINRPGISNSERSHFSKVYGINRLSILNQLPEDVMHVILEGVFPLHLELY
jgi:hypothetical protein